MPARLSELSDTPPRASHAKVLAPVVAQENGAAKAREVITAIRASGKELTAAVLAAQVERLGYARTIPGQSRLDKDQVAARSTAAPSRLAESPGRLRISSSGRALCMRKRCCDDVAPLDRGAATNDVHRLAWHGLPASSGNRSAYQG
ncbi:MULTISPECIES: hypothetical protein [unclassified Streptomyces]|uniref:hypothetical protein n=1 Tax=unclassified Streptomyces TaxID=2593676 RepID=UPI001E39F409|nr:hypothetical protein [Streptomyces sp. CB02980]MCB8907682.1 hypothetical protein [Streptomyces sp. CB02980]